MNDIQTFVNDEFGKIRVIEIDGVLWFVGKDIAEKLQYSNHRKALKDHVNEEDKMQNDGVTIRDSIGRVQKPIVINESGLYSLILGSKLESAKRFKRWITSEVLPSLRKNGAYMTPDKLQEVLQKPESLITLLETLKAEQEKNTKLNTVNAALTDKAMTWDNRLVLNALVRAYSGKVKNNIFGAGWNDFYKNLQYSEHINLKIRHGKTASKKMALIDYIKDDEYKRAIKVATAMCEKAGLDVAAIINEVNSKNLR